MPSLEFGRELASRTTKDPKTPQDCILNHATGVTRFLCRSLADVTPDLQHAFWNVSEIDDVASSYRPDHTDASGPMTRGDFQDAVTVSPHDLKCRWHPAQRCRHRRPLTQP